MSNYILSDNIIFDSKPNAVPYNYRISYKIAQLCLIISKSCRGKAGCSLIKLHIISNALNAKKYMLDLEKYVNDYTSYVLVSFDSAVNRALNFAIADGLVFQLKNGTFKLDEKGELFIKKINDEEIMQEEKNFLDKLGFKLTEKKIEQMMSIWRYKNVED